eukprot:1740480-Lingulodinium_polyedra.AAC.1
MSQSTPSVAMHCSVESTNLTLWNCRVPRPSCNCWCKYTANSSSVKMAGGPADDFENGLRTRFLGATKGRWWMANRIPA